MNKKFCDLRIGEPVYYACFETVYKAQVMSLSQSGEFNLGNSVYSVEVCMIASYETKEAPGYRKNIPVRKKWADVMNEEVIKLETGYLCINECDAKLKAIAYCQKQIEGMKTTIIDKESQICRYSNLIKELSEGGDDVNE